MSKEKCKYLGTDSGDCWRVSGNIFQKCISKNKEKCILLKNEQLHDKIGNLEQQLQAAKDENETLKRKLEFKQKDFDRAMSDFSESNAEIGTLEDLVKDKNIDIDNLTQQNKQMREALENAKKMFIEQGHCPWADGTGKFDCESCNDNCMFPSIQQALNQLKGGE